MKNPLRYTLFMLKLRWKRTIERLLALIMAGTACAQNSDLPYSSGSTGADGPLVFPSIADPRVAHSMAYDSARKSVVLFGGSTNAGITNDTWEWDGANWLQRKPAVTPAARSSAAMAYDSVRNRIVIFGGSLVGGSGNDTWEWDGTNWEQKNPSTRPSARNEHAMVFDAARQRILLFGGFTGTYTGDTWEWDGINWVQLNPSISPPPRCRHAMAYDSNRQKVVLVGGERGGFLDGDTWEWDGTNWAQRNPSIKPDPLIYHAMAYDSFRQKTVLFAGHRASAGPDDRTWEWDGVNWSIKASATVPPKFTQHALVFDDERKRILSFGGVSSARSADTWEWDGTDWILKAGSELWFDMSARATGVWNYTSIFVPSGVKVRFKKNPANTSVTWLATDAVNISGIIDLSGARGTGTNDPELVGKGGPGGFNGGLGGTNFAISGTYFGLPGLGPGGGAAGTTAGQNGQNATHSTTYGNIYLQPLIGGSGGGGGASAQGGNGSSGGGGGGAILIASSRDIVLSGRIESLGGDGFSGGTTAGGVGSGGAVRLVADRLLGGGVISVGEGRIRLEGFYRALAQSSHSPIPSSAPPTETFAAAAQGSLIVSNVAGKGVAQPPTGSLLNPDVVFNQAGPITITVTATNIPDGTPVRLRISTSGGIVSLPAVGAPDTTLQGGTAQFTTTVPAGLGSIQASAQYTAQ